jgi:hypothetical protein
VVALQDDTCAPEVRSLGRTIVRWRDQIVAWHHALVSNEPTEATTNLAVASFRIPHSAMVDAAGAPMSNLRTSARSAP